MTHPSQTKIGAAILPPRSTIKAQIVHKLGTNRAQIRYKYHQITKLVSERHKLRLKIEILKLMQIALKMINVQLAHNGAHDKHRRNVHKTKLHN